MEQTTENMDPFFSFPLVKLASSRYNRDTMTDKLLNQSNKTKNLWLTINDCVVNDTKGTLKSGVFIEVIQDQLGAGILPKIDDNSHPVFIRLITEV